MQVAKDSHRDRANKLQDQLTKAKNYLKFLLGVVHIKNTYNDEIEKEIAEVEQFINSEVEK